MPTKKKTETTPEKLTPVVTPSASIYKPDRVITIDGKYRVEDEQRSDVMQNLQRDFKSKRIFTGEISSVEYTSGNIPYAVLYHGDFKVIIPASEVMDENTLENLKEEKE